MYWGALTSGFVNIFFFLTGQILNNFVACEPQTYFRSSLLDDRKYVCGSQANNFEAPYIKRLRL